MTANRVRLDNVVGMGAGDIAALPPDQLGLLADEAAEALDRARRAKDRLDGALDLRYRAHASTARAKTGKATGTVRVVDGDFVIVADIPKRIDWNQDKLAAIVARIRQAGDDPAEYVRTTYEVGERAYGAWPSAIRRLFEPALTVETGKPTYRIEPAGKEAA